MKKIRLFSITAAIFTVFLLSYHSNASAGALRGEIVLVHGAFGDQAVWDGPDAENGVAELLRNRGYRVIAVTLPGLGRNHGQANESIDLESHVQHVLDVLEIDNVTEGTMVCHSYSGMICAAVQDRAPERLSKMVFFDATVPDSGESFFQSINFPPPEEEISCFPYFPASVLGLTDPDELAWLDERQTCQPIHTFDQPIDFSWNDGVKKYLIHATIPWFAYENFLPFKQKVINMGWNVYSILGSHYVSISNPKEFVKVLTLIDTLPYENWPFN